MLEITFFLLLLCHIHSFRFCRFGQVFGLLDKQVIGAGECQAALNVAVVNQGDRQRVSLTWDQFGHVQH